MSDKKSTFSAEIGAAVDRFQKIHHENLECLICQMVKKGHDPRNLEIVQRVEINEIVISVRVKSDG